MLVAQLCPILCNPMYCSPPGSSVHGILQARILELVAISYSRGYSLPGDQSPISYGRVISLQLIKVNKEKKEKEKKGIK